MVSSWNTVDTPARRAWAGVLLPSAAFATLAGVGFWMTRT